MEAIAANASAFRGNSCTAPIAVTLLELIKSHGLKAGVVINPATPVQTLGEVLDLVDYILVMSVNPGFGGQKFIPGSLEKVRKLGTMRTAKGLDYKIEIDGGVSLNNVAEIAKAGAEVLAPDRLPPNAGTFGAGP